MSLGLKEVNKRMRCPICGHADWCCYFPVNDGPGYLFACKRVKDEDDLIGVDGQTYTYISTSAAGNTVYELESQRADRIEAFKASRRGNLPKKSSYVRPEPTYEDVVEPLDNVTLDKIYRDFLSMYTLEEKDREWLHSKGYTDEIISTYCITSFPEDDYYRIKNKDTYVSYNPFRKTVAAKLSEKYGSLRGVPGAYRDRYDNWNFTGKSGIIMPQFDAQGRIYRLRIRLHDTSRGKMRNFSSYFVDDKKATQNIIANVYKDGCAANNNLGIYMPSNRHISDGVAIITEGEGKAMITATRMGIPVIAVPGVDSYKKLLEPDNYGKRVVDYLKEWDIDVLVTAYDADKENNKAVLDAQSKTISLLEEEGFDIAIANWNIRNGKGIDDLLVNGFKPQYEFV